MWIEEISIVDAIEGAITPSPWEQAFSFAILLIRTTIEVLRWFVPF